MRCMVKDGNPADAMAEAIAQFHPSILVAGVKRASETPGPHGTAFALLARSRVPVLCVPPETSAEGADAEVSNSGGSRLAARRTGSAAWRLTGDNQTSEDIAPSNLIEFICFSGLIAFGSDWPEMGHGSSHVRSAKRAHKGEGPGYRTCPQRG